jgi:hypothetical protein
MYTWGTVPIFAPAKMGLSPWQRRIDSPVLRAGELAFVVGETCRDNFR